MNENMSKTDKLDELRRRSSNFNDGIYCYYKDNDFYIYPFIEDLIVVFHNRKSYPFRDFDEMISNPFLNGNETIIDNLDDITW